MTVIEAARILGVSPQFIRLGLQQERLPIGTAVKTSDNRWTYDVREHLLKKYMGEDEFEKRANCNHLGFTPGVGKRVCS